MPEEVRADLLIGRDTLSPGLIKAGKAASDASSNVRQLTRDLYETGKVRATPVVDLNDAAATAKLGEVSAKLKELGAKVANPEIDVNDKKALADIAAVRVKLDVLGKKVSSPRISLEGLARAEAGILALDAQLDRLDAKHATASVGVRGGGRGGIFGRLGGLFGAGGSLGGGAESAGGSLAGGTFTGPALGVAAVLASSLFPALVPLGLGALVGAGATGGAVALGAKEAKQLQTLNRQLLTATGKRKQAIQQQIKSIQQSSGPELAIAGAVQDLGFAAKGLFTRALTSTGRGFSGGGPGGTQNVSFLTGLLPIFKQLGGFIDKLGPQLGQLFRASLPFVQAFVKVLEQFAKAVLPAMTQSLKELAPDLPILIQGFKYLSEGIAGFIKNLGPGMRDSAVIFKGAMQVVKGFLQLAGFAAAQFAEKIVDTGRAVRAIARGIPPFFDRMRHDIAAIFDGVRHDIAHYWDVIYGDTIGQVLRLDRDVVRFIGSLQGKIKNIFNGAISWLYNAGKNVVQGLWNGLLFIWHKVTSFISGIASWIKQHKGPVHLDATLLEPAGRALMGGLLKGLVGGFGGIADFVGGIAGKIGAALGGGAMGAEGIAAAMLPAYGWSPAQMAPLVALWNGESGWRWNARNPTSGAYGIPQALPASKMASAGADWLTNPATQIRWGLGYIKQFYGTPANAYATWLSRSPHWYGAGGMITEPILGVGRSGRVYGFGERGPEMVTPGRGSGGTVNNYVTVQVGHGTHPVAAAQQIVALINQGAMSGVRIRKSAISANG